MKQNNGKYFFIPDWLLQENSQAVHAYIYILNEINSNGGEFKISYRNLAKELNLSLQNIRTIIKVLTQQSTHKITQEKSSLTIDFAGVLGDLKKVSNTVSNTQATRQKTHKQPTKLTLEQRKETFIENLKKFTDIYDKDMLNDFYRYWVETDVNKEKMRFEFQKTWALNLRLITWQRNALKNFNKPQLAKPTEPKIGRTSIETIKKNAEYNGEY